MKLDSKAKDFNQKVGAKTVEGVDLIAAIFRRVKKYADMHATWSM